MFQHTTPWKFNPQNQDCVYCASLIPPEHVQHCWSPSWPRHQNTAGIAQMLAPHWDVFWTKAFFGNSERGWGLLPLRALHSLLSRASDLARGMGPSNGDDPWQIPVSSSLLFLSEQETPPAPHTASSPLPAPQIPGEWAEFGELGCPWRRRTRSQSSFCSWDGGDAVPWDIILGGGL